MNLTWVARDCRKDKHMDTVGLGAGGRGPLVEELQHPEAQCVYYKQLDREAGLLHSDKKEGLAKLRRSILHRGAGLML